MQHRNMDCDQFNLATIDDIIDRGKLRDWIELREACRVSLKIRDMVLHVCHHHNNYDFSVRYNFWIVYLSMRFKEQ